jgi:toxin ParE1/3/4
LKKLLPIAGRVVAEIRLSAEAQTDLIDIDEYGAEQFSPDIADIYSRGFNEVFSLLRRHPLAGAAKPELGHNLRCITHRRHRIFYVVNNDVVLIVRIIHHARDAQRILN